MQVAALLGVTWGDLTNSNGTRVFSAATNMIDNRLPLIAAVLQEDVDLIEVLLSVNGRINQCSEDGTTPLLQAVTQERLDIIELLINYNADFNATKHHSMGLLTIAIQAQNSAVIQLAISHMDPQLFASKGSLNAALRNMRLLFQIDKSSDLTHSIIGHCLLPKFLERWILSYETALEQVIGVLGTLLTIVPRPSTLYEQIRSLRNCVMLNEEFFDFNQFTHLTEQEGLHDFMSQLASQEDFRQRVVDRSTLPPTIVPRHVNGTRFETISHVGRPDNRPVLFDQTTGLCCSDPPRGLERTDRDSGA